MPNITDESFNVPPSLADLAERMKQELNVLSISSDSIHVSYDEDDDTLIVYAEKSLKAYFPKKYHGYRVEFLETSGGEIMMDMDTPIKFVAEL